MEDRYLSKAKRTDNGEWVQGAYFEFEGEAYIMDIMRSFMSAFYNQKSVVDFNTRAYEVDKNSICQCTGLKNRKGNLIFENDIIKDLFSDVCAPIKYGSYQSCFDSTKVEHIGFYVDWVGRYDESRRKDLGYWINMVDAEIVGNIFDNPELCWERNNNGKNY